MLTYINNVDISYNLQLRPTCVFGRHDKIKQQSEYRHNPHVPKIINHFKYKIYLIRYIQ